MKKSLISKRGTNNGITLIALVITIIVLLILAGISIATLTGENGVLTQASKAKEESKKRQAEEEVKLAIEALKIEESQEEMTQIEKREELEKQLKKYDSTSTVIIDQEGYIAYHKGYEIEINSDFEAVLKEAFTPENWDKTAAPEDVFIWASDDPNSADYGVIIGYTSNVDNYPTLRYPSRCTEIQFANDLNYNGINTQIARAFTGNILEVEIPETVTIIGDFAFGTPDGSSFENLKSVEIPNSVTSIGIYAFAHCNKLNNIVIPNSVISIGDRAFEMCDGLTDVTLSNGLISIGESVFYMSSLTNITLPDTVEYVGSGAFNSTSWWNDFYSKQPDGLIYLGKTLYAYKETIPENTSIEIKEGTNSIAGSVFRNQTGLTEIIVPDSVTSIGFSAFSSCTSLESVTIPDTVTSIGEYAFNNVPHIYYNGTATGSPWGALAIN